MALATTCPQCRTSFKVVPDQLKLRRGLVRCGVCQHVFSGIDYLRYVSDPRPAPRVAAPPSDEPGNSDLKTAFFIPDTVFAPPASAQPPRSIQRQPVIPLAVVPPSPPAAALAAGGASASLAETTTTVARVDSRDPSPAVDPARLERAAPDDAPAAQVVAGSGADVDEDAAGRPGIREQRASPVHPPVIVGETHADDESPADSVAIAGAERAAPGAAGEAGDGTAERLDDRHADSPAPEVGGEFAPPRRAVDEPARARADLAIAPEPVADDAEPRLPSAEIDAVDFFRTGRTRTASFDGMTPTNVAIAVLLATVLALQAAIAMRNELAARIPALRPALTSLVGPLGMQVELPLAADAITIESFELTAGNRPGVFTLNALLRNRVAHPVRWPAMELTLTDTVGAILVRKVLMPAEYLGAPDAVPAGMPESAERALRFSIEARDVSPSGYRARLFHP